MSLREELLEVRKVIMGDNDDDKMVAQVISILKSGLYMSSFSDEKIGAVVSVNRVFFTKNICIKIHEEMLKNGILINFYDNTVNSLIEKVPMSDCLYDPRTFQVFAKVITFERPESVKTTLRRNGIGITKGDEDYAILEREDEINKIILTEGGLHKSSLMVDTKSNIDLAAYATLFYRIGFDSCQMAIGNVRIIPENKLTIGDAYDTLEIIHNANKRQNKTKSRKLIANRK